MAGGEWAERRKLQRVAMFGALLMGSTFLAGVVAVSPAAAQATANAPRQFDIPAQPLREALIVFSRQSGLQVSAQGPLVEGRTSTTVSGGLAPAEALSRLLTGTGLTYRFNGSDAVTVERAPQGGGAVQLGAVQVEATGGALPPPDGRDPTTTEGSRSYTTRAMSTATSLPLSIRETPQSVTVLTQQLIEDRAITDLVDVVENAPGLSINRYESNRGSLFSRGFKIENYLLDGVPTIIDEQWSAGEILSNTAILDRVEVLRGSDGLMVGTGNPSAVINMIRKRADSDVFAGSLSLEVSQWSRYGATLDLSGPLSRRGSTRGRLVADYDKHGSYIDRLENTNLVLFGTIEQDIGDRTLLSAGVSHQDNHTDSPTWGGVPAWTLDSANAVIPLDMGRSVNPSANWSYWDSDYTNAFVRLEHRFSDDWTAKAAYTRGERNSESRIVLFYPYPIHPTQGVSVMAYFGMVSPQPGYAGTYWVENVKDDTNLRLDGAVNLFGRRHELVFGYDHSQEAFTADGAAQNPTLATTPNIFTFNGDAVYPGDGTRGNFKNHEITQKAFYATGRFTLLEPLKLIVGARLVDYKVDDHKAPANSYDTDTEFLPYAGLVFSPTRNLSVYVSYTDIFQPQNYLDAGNALLAPIEGNTYEAGIKGEFFNGRLNAALSVFKMEQTNLALFSERVPIDPANPTGPKRNAYVGADGAESEGFEVEVSGEILPDWNIYTGYSEFEAKLASGADVNSLIPRQQFNLFTSYRLPGAWRNLTIGGGARWQSEVWVYQLLAQVLGVPRLEQKAYWVGDLMARYELDDRWSLQLNVENVLDEKYFAPTDDGMQRYWQAPRNAQLRLKRRF